MARRGVRMTTPPRIWIQRCCCRRQSRVKLAPRPYPSRSHGRVPDRKAMDAVFFVLRTGCSWHSLNATGNYSSSSANRRFRKWSATGVFLELRNGDLQEYDTPKGIQWDCWSMDGAMTKAPLGGGKNRSKSDGSGQIRGQAEPSDRWGWDSAGDRGRRSESGRLPGGASHD